MAYRTVFYGELTKQKRISLPSDPRMILGLTLARTTTMLPTDGLVSILNFPAAYRVDINFFRCAPDASQAGLDSSVGLERTAVNREVTGSTPVLDGNYFFR